MRLCKKSLVLAILILGVYFFYGTFISLSSNNFNFTLYIAWLGILLAYCTMIAIVPCTKKGEFDWSAPIAIVVITSFGEIITPIIAMRSNFIGYWISGGYTATDLTINAVSLNALGIFLMIIGYLTIQKSFGYNKIICTKILSYRAPPKGLGIFLFLIGATAIIILVFQAGGISNLLLNIYARRQIFSGIGFLMPAVFMLPVGIALLLIRLDKNANSLRNFSILLILAVTVFLALMTLGGRGLAVRGVLLIFVIYSIFVDRISLKTITLFAVIALIILPFLGELRIATRSLNELSVNAVLEALLTNEKPDSETGWLGLQRTVVVLSGVPDPIPYQYFTTLSRIITTLIPRELWPDKPGLSEASVYAPLFGTYTGGEFGMYPAGQVGDYYLQAGIFGVLIGFIAQGFLLAFFSRIIHQHRSDPIWVVGIYILVIFGAYQVRNIFIFQGMTALLLYLSAVFIWRSNHKIQ